MIDRQKGWRHLVLRQPMARGLWARTGIALCNTHSAGVLGVLALRALLSDWPPTLVLINSFTPFLFLPLLLTLPLALKLRSKPALAGSVAVLAAFLGLYGPLFLPRSDPVATPAGDQLNLMTFNLGYRRAQPQQLIEAIASEGADVVALQELAPAMAYRLQTELRERYPYTVLEPRTSSTGLLSRYPILTTQWFRPASRGRLALQATLDWNGAIVTVLVAHPRSPGVAWFKRLPLPTGINDTTGQRQVIDVAQRAAGIPGPLLVMGDLNMSDQTRAYSRLTRTLKDAYREAGWGFGFTFPHGVRLRGIPLPGPLVRIDYILHSADFDAQWARVGCKGGSDHCYLTAQLSASFPAGSQSVSQAD